MKSGPARFFCAFHLPLYQDILSPQYPLVKIRLTIN